MKRLFYEFIMVSWYIDFMFETLYASEPLCEFEEFFCITMHQCITGVDKYIPFW